MHPKISVIIVVYNGANVIEKSITSVLSQTYNNKELIIVDGGSTDNTISIVKEIQNTDLSWKSEPDNGIYDAMNKGIERATGEWIYFLGADDEFYNKEVLNDLFGDNGFENIDFIYGNVKRVGLKGVYDGEFDFGKLLVKNISHQAIFYNRNIFQKVGKYNLKFKTHADWDFNIRSFGNNQVRIKYTDKIIARFGEGGASSSYDIPFMRESLLPEKLRFLVSGKTNLRNIKEYDEHWRFIRNSGLRNKEDFKKSGYQFAIPEVILSMANRQNKLPEGLLKKGVFSKIFMFINYLFSNYKIGN